MRYSRSAFPDWVLHNWYHQHHHHHLHRVVIIRRSIIRLQARLRRFSSPSSLRTWTLATRVTTSSARAVFVLQAPNPYEIRWRVKASAHFIGRKTKAQVANPQARPYH